MCCIKTHLHNQLLLFVLNIFYHLATGHILKTVSVLYIIKMVTKKHFAVSILVLNHAQECILQILTDITPVD